MCCIAKKTDRAPMQGHLLSGDATSMSQRVSVPLRPCSLAVKKNIYLVRHQGQSQRTCAAFTSRFCRLLRRTRTEPTEQVGRKRSAPWCRLSQFISVKTVRGRHAYRTSASIFSAQLELTKGAADTGEGRARDTEEGLSEG